MKNVRPLRPTATGNGREEAARQALWTGTISFSLVAIPVQMVKAVEPGRVSFRLLHDRDYSPLLRRMVCPREGQIVPPEEIIRGYETAPGRYVLITDEELESLSPERSRTIEIVSFVNTAELDSLLYRHPYYLIPAKGGEKAYRLLVEAMRRTGKAGIAKFVLGEREHPVAIRSTAGALGLFLLHYREELILQERHRPPEEAVDASERRRLVTIIGEMITDFDPHKYADERRRKIFGLLNKKGKAKAMVEAPAATEEPDEGPADLFAVLQESMNSLKKARR